MREIRMLRSKRHRGHHHHTLVADGVSELTDLREALAAEIVQGGPAKPSPEVASEYADRLIATLGVK